jgi:hypothetical protein
MLDRILHHSTIVNLNGGELPAQGQTEGRTALCRVEKHQALNPAMVERASNAGAPYVIAHTF